MKFSVLTAVGAALLLTACGGSGTASKMVDEPPRTSIDTLIARGNAFENAIGFINVDELTPSPDSALPTTDSAGFTGVALAFRENATDEEVTDFAAIGSTRLTIDFDAGTVAGTADDFYQVNNTEVETFDGITGTSIAGQVTYNLTLGANEDNYYEGRVTGSLTELSGATFDINLPAGAALTGDAAEGFAIEAFEDGNLGSFGVLALRD